jgi:hypothetical protein
VVACLPLDLKFAGSDRTAEDEIFKGDKNPQHDFLRRGSEAVGPMSWMLKVPSNMKEILSRQNLAFPCHAPPV